MNKIIKSLKRQYSTKSTTLLVFILNKIKFGELVWKKSATKNKFWIIEEANDLKESLTFVEQSTSFNNGLPN